MHRSKTRFYDEHTKRSDEYKILDLVSARQNSQFETYRNTRGCQKYIATVFAIGWVEIHANSDIGFMTQNVGYCVEHAHNLFSPGSWSALSYELLPIAFFGYSNNSSRPAKFYFPTDSMSIKEQSIFLCVRFNVYG